MLTDVTTTLAVVILIMKMITAKVLYNMSVNINTNSPSKDSTSLNYLYPPTYRTCRSNKVQARAIQDM